MPKSTTLARNTAEHLAGLSLALFAGKQADTFASDDILLYGFIAQKADAE